MKKKKLKKLIETTINKYKKSKESTQNSSYITVSSTQPFEELMNDYDEEVSENFYKFVVKAGKATDKFTTSTSSERMTITVNIGSDVIDLIIHRKGFRINRYNSSGIFTIGAAQVKQSPLLSFKDDKMFDRLSPFLNSVKQESHREAFLNEIDEICISTKLSRESNLEELLNDENNDDKC